MFIDCKDTMYVRAFAFTTTFRVNELKVDAVNDVNDVNDVLQAFNFVDIGDAQSAFTLFEEGL